MTTFILLYLLIGLATWATHALTCDGCRTTMARLTVMGLESIHLIFGWPIELYMLTLFYLKNPNLGRLVDESDEAINLSRHENETDESYRARLTIIAQELVEQWVDQAE